MDKDQTLKSLRIRIDTLDDQIQKLINERGELAQEVARVKIKAGDDPNFYRAEREAQILKKVITNNQGPIPGEDMARLFREIMSSCLALEQPLTIAFLGPQGTFTQAAVFKHFGHAVKTTPLGAIDEVFREVESGSSDYGVVPIENSTEGVINHTLDMFMNSPLKICGEIDLRVHHNLLASTKEITAIQRIYSHHQSFAQCREWLDTHLSGVERIAVSSNADAARRANQQPDSAAIAGEIAANIYKLNIIAAKIEDYPDNTTRFLVIGRHDTPMSGDDKTSLLVSTMNKPGALHRLIDPIASKNISMTRIESRPSKLTMWDYVFFIDIEGHRSEKNVAKALNDLEKESAMLKILGSYPKAVL